MAVELDTLYHEIYSKYEVRLQTTSCFHKKISWLHLIENVSFTALLHGDELVFNSMLNDASEEERKNFIDELLKVDAGGLIVSIKKGNEFSQELIDYCNEKHFPLFATSWFTPFINIMRRFSEMLLDSERKEMNVTAAFQNAIYHPQDTSLYLNTLEESGFSDDSYYTVSILALDNHENEDVKNFIEKAKKQLRSLKHSMVFTEKNTLVIFMEKEFSNTLIQQLQNLPRSVSGISLAIGSTEYRLTDIYHSYHNAKIAMNLIENGTLPSPLCYDDIGTYQILANVTDSDTIFPNFVEDTLGKLMEYDNKHKTKYMTVLKDFFENDCSITQTADATFYHQNTLKYKIKNIKEILGYDIMTNENRVKIMLSLYILEIQKEGQF